VSPRGTLAADHSQNLRSLSGKEISVKTPAILLIAVGIVIVVWGAFGFKTRDKVLDVGPIHATKETTHNVPYGPLAGAILAIGGVVLLVKSRA
jgi:drug/metabolite transporter (DMT)-like permease